MSLPQVIRSFEYEQYFRKAGGIYRGYMATHSLTGRTRSDRGPAVRQWRQGARGLGEGADLGSLRANHLIVVRSRFFSSFLGGISLWLGIGRS